MRLVHPARGLVAQLFELSCQTFADLPAAALDLAPVAGLDLDAFGEPALQPAQCRGVGVTRGGSDEFLEQRQRVVQAYLGEVAHMVSEAA